MLYSTRQHTSSFDPRRSPLVRCTRRRRCPVCDRDHYCSVSADGALCVCTKKPSGRQTRDGQGWVHILRFDAAPRPVQRTVLPPRVKRIVERAPADRVHAVYTDLRRLHLVLSEEHRRSLRARGLSDEAIEMIGYRSAPTPVFAKAVARALARDHDLRGVPGFFMRGGEWHLSFGGWNAGIVIPVFDTERRIRALSIRRDDTTDGAKYVWLSSKDKLHGASPGAPPNFSRPELVAETSELLITEGVLKSQIVSELEGIATCGVAGVATFGQTFGGDLRRALPRLERAVVAYDADFLTNRNVHRALTQLIRNLRAAGLRVSVRLWDAALGKGLDDALLALKGAA